MNLSRAHIPSPHTTFTLLYHLTRHFLLQGLLRDANTALGKDGQSSNRHGNGNFLVARDSSRDHEAASVKLGVESRATIVLKLASDAEKGRQAGRSRLAAALGVAAADSSLKYNTDECIASE